MYDDVQRTTAPLSPRSRLVRVGSSYLLVAFGVAALIQAGLGVAPFDVLNTGVAELLGIAVGLAFLINATIAYAIGAALGGKLGWASLVGTIVISPLLEVFLHVLPAPDLLALRVPMFVIGVTVLTAAICLVISTEMGPGPTEVVMLGMVTRGVRVARARWIIDGLVLIVGIALGGAAGAGTVVIALALGPLVAFGLRVLRYTPPGAPTPVAVAVLV